MITRLELQTRQTRLGVDNHWVCQTITNKLSGVNLRGNSLGYFRAVHLKPYPCDEVGHVHSNHNFMVSIVEIMLVSEVGLSLAKNHKTSH